MEPEPTHDLDLLADERVRRLFEAAVDAVVVLDDTAGFRWASPGAEEMLGATTEELRALDPLSLVHPEDLPQAAHLLGRMLEGIDDDDPAVVRLRTSGRGEIWAEIRGKDLTDVPGVGGVVLTARDITFRVDLEHALGATHRRFESLLRNSNDAIVILDEALRITYTSPSIERLSGYPPEVITGLDVSDVVLDPQRADLLATLNRVTGDPGLVDSLHVRIRHADGGTRWLAVRVSNRLEDDAIAGVIANVRDVTDVMLAEQETAQLTRIFDLTDDLVVMVDGESLLTYMNPACARFFGIDPGETPLGRHFHVEELAQHTDGPRWFETGSRTWDTEVVLTSHDGNEVPFAVQLIAHLDDDGTIVSYSAVGHDISESRKLATSLEHQTLHDPLTGLPNRKMLERRLEDRRSGGHEDDTTSALLFIDLDNFKVINDSLGHAFGDRLLQAAADRLRAAVRSGDLVVRFGGDEFVILCDDTGVLHAGRDIARRVAEAFSEALLVDGNPIHVSVSIGIAERPGGTPIVDPGELLRDADTAMYQAKASGRGRVVVFDDGLRRRAVERQSIESALRDAPHDGSLVLHHQPIVDLATGRLRGVEALVRWNHSGRLLGPGEFIPIAEETDLILPLGSWVLDAACAELARWQQLPGWGHLGVSVNVSVKQLHDDGFSTLVGEAVRRHRIPRRSLTLELTESVLLDDTAMERSRLDRLDQLGVNLAIDDFGTGYSSLTYLASLPADVVKLDRTFLEAASSDRVRAKFVSGVVDLVKVLGLRCVAEGIESEEQFQQLRGLGCHSGQGYHIARPMPAEDLVARLVDMDPPRPWPRSDQASLDVVVD